MRLYRFLNAENGIRSLTDKRLRVGRIEELNDDFEFIGVATDIRSERIALRNTRKQLSKQHGVLCMSRTWESPLMWAHYGDSHKGMVLGFDVPDHLYPAVEYVEKRPSREEMGLSNGKMSEATMRRLIKMKAKGWEYEQEHRAFVGLTEGILLHGAMHYFVDFGPQLILKEAIVGSRFRTQRSELMRLVNDPGVDIYMARGDFEDFKLVRQHQDSMWP